MKKAKLRATRIPDTKLILGITTTLNALKRNADQIVGVAHMIAELEAVFAPFADATKALINAKMELKQCASAKNAKRKLAERAWARVAYRVEGQAQRDAGLLLTAGLPVTNDPGPVYMTKVFGLRLTSSRNEGELFARWKPVRRARAYEVQLCTDEDTGPTHWRSYRMSTKTRCSINQGLVSGQKVWARVRAVGAHGEGSWSDPVRQTVP